MPQAKKHTAEEIIPKLRTAELEIAKGQTATRAANCSSRGRVLFPIVDRQRRDTDEFGEVGGGKASSLALGPTVRTKTM